MVGTSTAESTCKYLHDGFMVLVLPKYTLKLTDIAPENQCLEDVLLGRLGLFSGAILVLSMVVSGSPKRW